MPGTKHEQQQAAESYQYLQEQWETIKTQRKVLQSAFDPNEQCEFTDIVAHLRFENEAQDTFGSNLKKLYSYIHGISIGDDTIRDINKIAKPKNIILRYVLPRHTKNILSLNKDDGFGIFDYELEMVQYRAKYLQQHPDQTKLNIAPQLPEKISSASVFWLVTGNNQGHWVAFNKEDNQLNVRIYNNDVWTEPDNSEAYFHPANNYKLTSDGLSNFSILKPENKTEYLIQAFHFDYHTDKQAGWFFQAWDLEQQKASNLTERFDFTQSKAVTQVKDLHCIFEKELVKLSFEIQNSNKIVVTKNGKKLLTYQLDSPITHDEQFLIFDILNLDFSKTKNAVSNIKIKLIENNGQVYLQELIAPSGKANPITKLKTQCAKAHQKQTKKNPLSSKLRRLTRAPINLKAKKIAEDAALLISSQPFDTINQTPQAMIFSETQRDVMPDAEDEKSKKAEPAIAQIEASQIIDEIPKDSMKYSETAHVDSSSGNASSDSDHEAAAPALVARDNSLSPNQLLGDVGVNTFRRHNPSTKTQEEREKRWSIPAPIDTSVFDFGSLRFEENLLDEPPQMAGPIAGSEPKKRAQSDSTLPEVESLITAEDASQIKARSLSETQPPKSVADKQELSANPFLESDTVSPSPTKVNTDTTISIDLSQLLEVMKENNNLLNDIIKLTGLKCVSYDVNNTTGTKVQIHRHGQETLNKTQDIYEQTCADYNKWYSYIAQISPLLHTKNTDSTQASEIADEIQKLHKHIVLIYAAGMASKVDYYDAFPSKEKPGYDDKIPTKEDIKKHTSQVLDEKGTTAHFHENDTDVFIKRKNIKKLAYKKEKTELHSSIYNLIIDSLTQHRVNKGTIAPLYLSGDTHIVAATVAAARKMKFTEIKYNDSSITEDFIISHQEGVQNAFMKRQLQVSEQNYESLRNKFNTRKEITLPELPVLETNLVADAGSRGQAAGRR